MAQVARMPSKRRPSTTWYLIGFILLIVAGNVFINQLYAVRLHAALGYGAVFTKNLTFSLATKYVGAIVYGLLAWLSVQKFRSVMPRLPHRTLAVFVALVGWGIGFTLWTLQPSQWFLFFHHAPFHQRDPLFHLDYSFYAYDLPILQGIAARIIFTIILWLMTRIAWFAATMLRQNTVTANLPAKEIHGQLRRLLLSMAFLFLLFAAVATLNRYAMALWPGNGQFIFGPDYVTAHISIPIASWLRILAWLVVTGSVVWMAVRVEKVFPVSDGFVVLRFRPFRFPVAAAGSWVLVLILSSIANSLVNSLYVAPNQNTAELPYIQDTINATRFALGINKVETKPFVPTTSITAASIKRDQNAVDNVRINDQNQTTQIYNQLQSFKSYFEFDPASVDRYGTSEVYISAREMNISQLPVQTWINKTLVYTHGYGVAVSPVNQFSNDGLPVLWAGNTPQQTQAPLPKVTQPRIYFGTQGNDVIAPSKQPEFDYPAGSNDATSHYKGGYGLLIRGNRWLLTLMQGTLRYYTTDQLVPASEFLFDRNIYQRVEDIAPFLRYDHDAFPFINNKGQILWMMDAYTTASNIPYAEPYMGTSYIRNSVKVVINAYTGKVTYYVVDKSDPILKSYEAIYPTLFTQNVPSDIRAHFRYPMDLFQAQATALTRYHMTNAAAFYNQDDKWALAYQIYQQNNVTTRPPVYQEIRMPDQTSPQFVLSELFTPVNKDNLNGWLVADNRPSDYGKLSLYQFPQGDLIFGPMQAENEIDTDPTLSAQLSLWNQQGSQVIRGDLLMIPVGDALLYVEPIYLVANRQNSLPQLQRVVLDFNKQVFVNTTLSGALTDLLRGEGLSGTVSTGSGAGAAPAGGTGTGGKGVAARQPAGAGALAQRAALIARANALFAEYEKDTAKGQFTAAGQALQQLGNILKQLTNMQ